MGRPRLPLARVRATIRSRWISANLANDAVMAFVCRSCGPSNADPRLAGHKGDALVDQGSKQSHDLSQGVPASAAGPPKPDLQWPSPASGLSRGERASGSRHPRTRWRPADRRWFSWRVDPIPFHNTFWQDASTEAGPLHFKGGYHDNTRFPFTDWGGDAVGSRSQGAAVTQRVRRTAPAFRTAATQLDQICTPSL